jgi:hypothetical protein
MCTNGCQNLSNDPDNCGMCGRTCTEPPVVGSGSATCGASTCGFVCNGGNLKCAGTTYCQAAAWGFENDQLGTSGGFGILGNGEMAVTTISVSDSVARSGSRSLAIAIDAKGPANSFLVGLRVCGGSGHLPSNAQSVSAWFFLSPSSEEVGPPHPSSQFGEYLYTTTGDGGNLANVTTVGTWFRVTTPIESVGTDLLRFALEGVFGGSGPGGDWTGTVYVDDIVIQ